MPSKAKVIGNFEKRVRDLQSHAEEEAQARTTGEPVQWFRPTGFSTDPFDTQSLADGFSRDEANVDFSRIINPEDPGTTGDLIAVATMVDYLAVMQRAFRARHTASRARMAAQAAARKKGHGNVQGVFSQLPLEYVRNLLRKASES